MIPIKHAKWDLYNVYFGGLLVDKCLCPWTSVRLGKIISRKWFQKCVMSNHLGCDMEMSYKIR